MDVHYFLTDRIGFIRQFYERAAQPFLERQRQIDAGEGPFPPRYSESGEPPYLGEWIEASESLQVLGYSCLSMLAGTLHLYLEAQSGLLQLSIGNRREKGWFNRYRALFSEDLDIQFENSPADLALLEEV